MADNTEHKLLGEILLERGLVSEEVLDKALELQQETMLRIGEQLVEMEIITEKDVTSALSEQLGVEIFNTEDQEDFPIEIIDDLDFDFLDENKVIPVHYDAEEKILTIVHHDPLNIFIADDLEHQTGLKIKFCIDTKQNITAALNSIRAADATTLKGVEEDLGKMEVVDRTKEDSIDLGEAEGPIVRLVNLMISTGISEGCSDIHVEPSKKRLRIRYRKSGVLTELIPIPGLIHAFQPELISRLKLMAKMDISESRIPQDGRIKVSMGVGKAMDMRVNSLPVQGGEKVCMRILDSSSLSLGLDQIGFSKHTMDIFRRNCKKPNGMILMTGPTGSGKTTTLYSALHYISTPEINICTVEDPVEYAITNYNQTQIHHKIGFTFADALKGILRQDPDVILVGEMRDKETAIIGVEAAMTGHLLFSTLHTNSAAGAIGRLIDMGVPPYLVASTLLCIVAQRLTRQLCPSCKQQIPLFKELAQFAKRIKADVKSIYNSEGCRRCDNSGYKGRSAIHETLENSGVLRDCIRSGQDEHTIESEARKIGFINLREDAMIKVLQGKMDEKEMNRHTR
ncbi:Flp pilus assembly complex ATPase component TadA [bacterium]|jgi:type IV pilus assembly protein PilB|nr:Flp pilus assembly complex ATPase component TadA [bacterium]